MINKYKTTNSNMYQLEYSCKLLGVSSSIGPNSCFFSFRLCRKVLFISIREILSLDFKIMDSYSHVSIHRICLKFVYFLF